MYIMYIYVHNNSVLMNTYVYTYTSYKLPVIEHVSDSFTLPSGKTSLTKQRVTFMN